MARSPGTASIHATTQVRTSESDGTLAARLYDQWAARVFPQRIQRAGLYLAQAVSTNPVIADGTLTVRQWAAAACTAIAVGTASWLDVHLPAPVADLAALAALDDTGMVYGTAVWVVDVGDWYILTSGSHTADGICVIAAYGPVSGYWIARHQGRWDDLQGDLAQSTAVASLTQEAYRDTPKRGFYLRHNQADALHYTYQMRHRWKVGTKVYPHLHFRPMSNGTGTFAMAGQYAWSDPDEALPANASWTTFTATISVAAADQYKTKILPLVSAGITPPAGMTESAILEIYAYRDLTSDTYTTAKDHGTAQANIGVVSSDVHYQADKLGSEVAYPA